MRYVIVAALLLFAVTQAGCVGMAAAIYHDQQKARQAGIIE